MIIALYKPSLFQSAVARVAQVFGVSIVEWEGNSNKRFGQVVKFPESSSYVSLVNESREFLDIFFSESFDSAKHTPSDLYFRKNFDLSFFDYYVFRKQIANSDYRHVYFLGGGYRKHIFQPLKLRLSGRILFFWNLFCCYRTLFVYAAKAFISCLLYKGEAPVCDVMYLRKKPYPDLGMKDKLSEHLDNLRVSNGSCITQFSTSKEQYGFSFLNALDSSRERVLRVAFSVLTEIYPIALLQFVNNINNREISSYIKDIFIAKTVIFTESKKFVGVLVDKPMFVLLYQYKLPGQLIMGINESFFYPPFRSFDYNQLDVYFSMNSIDFGLQNRFGGIIEKNIEVEFFRNNLVTNSKGLSDDLRGLIDKHDKVAVATAMQVSESSFTQWDVDNLNNFVLGVSKTAKDNPNDLFILKGKKNELSHLRPSVLADINALENIFVIYSQKPRLLKYNQFEDLLEVASFVISMSHTSTTVWQAISANIPVIAINDSHPSSFLSEYSCLEVTSTNLSNSYKYWRSMSQSKLDQFLKKIQSRVNIGNSNGLLDIAKYIASSENSEKN